MTQVLNARTVAHGARAVAAGHHQTSTRGDGYQNGGVVVIDADGALLYRHVEREAGDLADLDDVMEALDNAG